MGIDFKFNVTRKITINGKEYRSPDEVPEEFRGVVRDAIGRAASEPGQRRISADGITYDGPEDAPPDIRGGYVETVRRAPFGPGAPDKYRAQAPERTLSARTVIIALLVAAAIFLIKFMTRG
ncbi:MAG TPA: hypothetical protein PL037_05430 [Elusimicrobiales bacterium]|nr:hypothetical protein [Elusimicrobiales bacterium]